MNSNYFVNSIKEIARDSLKYLPKNSPSMKEAKLRVKRPVDYLRMVEFPAVAGQMKLSKGERVLDVGSPQWFTLIIAKDNPEVEFFYLNILKDEIYSINDIAKVAEIRNLHYVVGDVRNLSFPASFFSYVLSISVIEHIAPERNGDYIALKEIGRILNPHGKFIFSVPFKESPRTIYLRGSVYERKGRKEFFAREYDLEKIKNLVETTGFEIEKIDFIIERKGPFALDYWRWSGGRKSLLRYPVLGFLKFFDKLGFSLEDRIAMSYLYLSKIPEKGVVCAVLTLKKRR